MSFAVLFVLLFIAMAIGGAVLLGITLNLKGKKIDYVNKVDLGPKKVRRIIGIVLLSLALVGIILIPGSFHTVEAGEIAVVKHLGEAREVRTAGTYFDFWVTEKYEVYDAKVQNMTVETQSYSKDAQTMDVTMIVQYQIDTSKVIDIANRYGSIETLAQRIESVSTEKAKASLSAYSAMNIIETRSQISPLVEEVIKTAVDDEYCVDIIAVVLTNIDFSDAFEKTVEDKMIAEQEKLKAQYEKETAIVNAEKALEVAKLDAQAKIERAKADAEAQIKVAEAEAESIKLRSIEVARALGFTIVEEEILEDDVVVAIEYEIDFTGKSSAEVALITEYLKYIEYLGKWDGKLPTVMTDSNASIMLPVDSIGGTGSLDGAE